MIFKKIIVFSGPMSNFSEYVEKANDGSWTRNSDKIRFCCWRGVTGSNPDLLHKKKLSGWAAKPQKLVLKLQKYNFLNFC